MIKIYTRKIIAPGVSFGKITDKRFKDNKIFIRMFSDLSEIPREDAACAAYHIAECCEKFPDYKSLSLRLLELYDATLDSGTSVYCTNRATTLAVSVLDDRYALEGEKLEKEITQTACDCLFRPLTKNGAFDEKTHEMLKNQLIDNIDGVISDKSAYAAERAARTAYDGEAAALPPVGIRENAEKITPQSVFAAYKKILETARFEIFAAGCSDFSESEEIFTREFESFGKNRAKITSVVRKPSALKEKTAEVCDELEMEQAILRMYFKSPEVYDRPANMVFSRILCGMPTSRFFTNIREKQSLCYYCGGYADRYSRTLSCYAGVEPHNVARTREAMEFQLKKLCSDGIEADELEQAKLEIFTQLSSIYDSAAGMANWYLGQACEEEYLSPEQVSEQVRGVTAERAVEAARGYRLDTVYVLKNGGSEE